VVALPKPMAAVTKFRGGLVCKAHRLYVSLNSRLESNKEEEEEAHCGLLGCNGSAPHISFSLTFHLELEFFFFIFYLELEPVLQIVLGGGWPSRLQQVTG